MNIALLFNWRAYSDASNYWWATRELVFAPGIIQRSGRHMKMSVGDVLVGRERGLDPDLVYKAAVHSSKWRLVHEARLTEAFDPPTLFAMVFENMPNPLATELHDALTPSQGYLGAISVHFEFGAHLALYRARLPPAYRMQGASFRSLYAMGSYEERDEYDLKEMRRFGYSDVDFEDRGASRTILDEYDTPRHFQRVAAFRELITPALADGENEAYELAMMLEDLSPRLFNALGAAAERLANAETEEDVAQVALSGRRYMEQLADALFPPQEAFRGSRSLNKSAYKNRLWAFIEDNTPTDPRRFKALGTEVDRIVEELNGALHANRVKERISESLADAAKLTAQLLGLNPAAARNPYLAYSESVFAFAREAFMGDQPSEKDD